ncbi:hypothetical protein DXM27_20810 [Rhizobium rhizogenes]|uniref:Glycosyltransferase RgtA/B/C/D-like domain-containing protein n=1 Tax=Rhizobium rhizogenes TaxID=359 RepID=A0AA88EW56_RHIRH|nr:glycosyltransferase family 39 protein [Rhizobium rhizogenes]KAA3498875.1 hypothetical protein DXM27_20810 [Rhizobium rhizogenes]
MKSIDQRLALVAFATLCISAFFTIYYVSQPPLDMYAFRQTQTALTSYWFIKEGFALAYQTPVGGRPWAIPFEFPLYQGLVAIVAETFNLSLDVVGRLISYLFLLACLWPIAGIFRILKLNRETFYISAALLLSSPVYLYWGRSFMIETAALFFTIAFLYYFAHGLRGGFTVRCNALLLACATLALLQKSTTALPVLIITATIYAYITIRHAEGLKSLFRMKVLAVPVFGFLIPVLVAYIWVKFTDDHKSLNILGEQLTSARLSPWNWGTFAQRFEPALYEKVILMRIFVGNLGAVVGLILFIYFPIWCIRRGLKTELALFCIALALGFLPLFMFPNLHLVHTYYQSANLVFLLFAAALALGTLYTVAPRKVIVLVFVIIASNYIYFAIRYYPALSQEFSSYDRDVAVGKSLRNVLPDDGQFIAAGNDWSSTFTYMAERKSFMIKDGFADTRLVLANPDRYLDAGKVAALVSCGSNGIPPAQFADFVFQQQWSTAVVNDCKIGFSGTAFNDDNAVSTECHGAIDIREIVEDNGVRVAKLTGWVIPTDGDRSVLERVYVRLSASEGKPTYVEALRTPRDDVNSQLRIPLDNLSGFSALVPLAKGQGTEDFTIVRSRGDVKNICQLKH